MSPGGRRFTLRLFSKGGGKVDPKRTKKKLRWLRLDNAAKIYPAVRRKGWSNVFRLSATLTEPVDKEILQGALELCVRRFPSVCARLRKGLFWYYLQELPQAPRVREDWDHPTARMGRREMRRCALRVLVYDKRIAVEYFHALTDGTGGLIFLKSLVAEYLEQKYGIGIPAEEGVCDRRESLRPEELEDSFLKHAGPRPLSRRQETAWHPRGTPEPEGFRHLVCLELEAGAVCRKAKEYGLTVTAFLGAVMLKALLAYEREQEPRRRKQRPVKVLLPVNLRPLFGSESLRNFALYTTPGIDPRRGDYDIREIGQIVKHRMGLEITPKHMAAMMAANVSNERVLALRMTPLFLKNMVMRAVFEAVGECKSCLSLSNLGAVRLPEEMGRYVRRMDFILGVQAHAPHNCGVLSYDGRLYINFIRSIREPDLERHFWEELRALGLKARVQSNEGERLCTV